MKTLLPLLACLLLCGCARTPAKPQVQNPTIPPVTVAETQPAVLSEAQPVLLGDLTVYPLSLRKVREVKAVGDDLLVLAGRGNTTLALLTGDPLSVAGSMELDFVLEARQVQAGETALSFYDPEDRQLLVLDRTLTPQQRLPLPAAALGSPILSADGKILYYCTSSAIVAWDLESGIHRTVKELSYDSQELTGLHLKDTVLQCRIQDGTAVKSLFLSTDTGQLLSQPDGDVDLKTLGQEYYALLTLDSLEIPVFGQIGSVPQALYPEDTAAESVFLPHSHAAVTASLGENDCPHVNYYDLSTGTLRAQLTLDTLQMPKSMTETSSGDFWFLVYDPGLDQDKLCRWNVPVEAFQREPSDPYVGIYSGPQSQAPETLDQCRELAAQLSEKYGITIRVGEEALLQEPWDYTFQAETLPQVLWTELTLLDQRLSLYPEAVLKKTAACFPSLSICLVRSITGTTQSTRSLDSATGIQFLDAEGNAYVVISVGKFSQQALYHELFHVMETRIFNESTALDQWNSLNPPEFYYTFGFGAPENADQYLSGRKRAFVDSYSMTYPKEDRARIWENAMLPGNAELFEPEVMQKKLNALCRGVREAYGLKKSEEVFLWEQYLTVPPG